MPPHGVAVRIKESATLSFQKPRNRHKGSAAQDERAGYLQYAVHLLLSDRVFDPVDNQFPSKHKKDTNCQLGEIVGLHRGAGLCVMLKRASFAPCKRQ